ncbi:serine/threonine protein kinase [Asanoa siamensis]|uniref:non-specific serine/threonine protein kinase n=1 Tax=Asanoa siamensis TaxID=926357 RepID=A0ABQ4CP26_9ACTN|nr:serine/threonine protein kinase [Asanoa siamensis]GIF73036.1 hypothetical protein Asi02nite_25540 [Asanoa siamensis]
MSDAPRPLIADRYRLVEPLGQGGMGRVWLARDETLRRDVALKEIVPPAGLTDDERREMRERSMREARAIARLNQVNVVRVFDVLHTGDDPWIVMELVHSRSLHAVLAAEGPLAPARVAEIGLSVLAALRAAHRAGVLHRDVKPANVLLADDGRIVLTDFGLATVPGDPTVTRTGMVLGSPAYLAPERAMDGHTGPAADLWSLGATLYAAVEGRSPYARSTSIATPGRPIEVLDTVSPDTGPVAGRMPAPPDVSAGVPLQPGRPRRRLLIGVVAAVLVVGALAGVPLVGFGDAGGGAPTSGPPVADPGLDEAAATGPLASVSSRPSSRPSGTPGRPTSGKPTPSAPGTPSRVPVTAVPGGGEAPPPSPTKTAAPPAAGRPIVGHGSNRCITVPSGTASAGQQIQITDCRDLPGQRWTLGSDRTVRALGMCLDVAGGSTADGARVRLSTCDGRASQRFNLNPSHDLVSLPADRCVDVVDLKTTNGAPLQIWQCTGADNQKWSLR